MNLYRVTFSYSSRDHQSTIAARTMAEALADFMRHRKRRVASWDLSEPKLIEFVMPIDIFYKTRSRPKKKSR